MLRKMTLFLLRESVKESNDSCFNQLSKNEIRGWRKGTKCLQLEGGSVCGGDNSYGGKGEKDRVRRRWGQAWELRPAVDGSQTAERREVQQFPDFSAQLLSCTAFELQDSKSDSKSANDFLGEVVLRCVLHGKCTAISSGRGTSCPQKQQSFPLEVWVWKQTPVAGYEVSLLWYTVHAPSPGQ